MALAETSYSSLLDELDVELLLEERERYDVADEDDDWRECDFGLSAVGTCE